VTAAALIAVALSAEPSLLHLGWDARASVRVEAQEQPVVSASVGRVEKLRPAGAGSWVAEYVPPDDELPQVAILTAIAGGEIGWMAIPLWGAGDAVVKTRPGGRITVDIAGQTFGPAVADAGGHALVPVEVPPGVREARHGKRVIPLNVPPSRTVHLAFGAAGRSADQPQTIAVYAVAVTAAGEPRSGAQISIRTSRGTISAVRERAAGLYEASLSLQPGPPGPVRVSAALEDGPRFVAHAVLTLGGGPAQRIAISSDRDAIGADDPQARLHVTARDRAGNAPGEDLAFETTAGTLDIKAARPGEWDLTVSVPPAFGGRRFVEVRAQGAATAAAQVLPLAAGPAEVVTFENPLPKVIADGASRVRFPVQLRDRYGNEVSGVQPELSVDQGLAQLEEAGGALFASYLPPLLDHRSGAVLSLRAGKASGSAQVTLLPDQRAVAVSPKVGMLSNFSGFSAPLFGVEGALRTDRFGPQLSLSLEADYAHREQSEMVRVGTLDVLAGSRLDLVLVHLSAAWRLGVDEHSTLFIAAGPSAAGYWTRVTAADAPERRGFAVAPGAHATLGLERRLRLFVPFAEARAAWISSPGLPMLTGPLRTLTLFLGVRIEAL